MAYVINASCIACGLCEGECPVKAIVKENDKFVINASCIECGICAGVCPVAAPEKA